jgi:hypothetical protein
VFVPLQAITSACVASLSDLIAQKLIGTPYSLQRTIKMAVRVVFGTSRTYNRVTTSRVALRPSKAP